MSQRDVIWNSAKFIGTISVIAATVIPASAQQRPTSPVAAAPVENRYPDGSKLQSQYSSAQRSVVLPSAAPSVRANSAGFASAAAVQTDLPEGFSLLAAPTSHVGGTDQPVGANMAPATAADRVASSTEKFITVFPLAYRGVPLSKGSDYLTIVDGNGQIQATRKRAMPSKVDATQPTVSAGEAIQVARRDAGAASAGPDPKPELQIWVDDRQNGNLSWTFTLGPSAVGDSNVRKYWVAAVGEPRVLNWESEVYHTHNGVVSGNIWAASPFQATENRAFPSLEVTRLLRRCEGRSPTPKAVMVIPHLQAAPKSGRSFADRGSSSIINRVLGLESAQTGPAAQPINLHLGASDEDQLAQDSAFYWANFARDLARNILGPAELPDLPVLTNINQTCNAFWNGSSHQFLQGRQRLSQHRLFRRGDA